MHDLSAVAHLLLGNVRQPVRSLVFAQSSHCRACSHSHILVDRTVIFLAAFGTPLPRHAIRHAEARLQSVVKARAHVISWKLVGDEKFY